MQLDHYLVKDRLNRLNGMGFAIQHLGAYVRELAANPQDRVLHTHDVVELNYILSGCGVHHLGDRPFATGPGSLGIVHYTQPHDIITDQHGMSVINLYFDLQRFVLPDLGDELAGSLAAILPMHPSLRHRQNQFVHLQFSPGGDHEALLWAMLREQQQQGPGYREAMTSQLRLFLIACARVARAQGQAVLPEIRESEARVERLRRQLDADPTARVDLRDLARRIGWSVPHLCRTFRRHTGTSVLVYLQRQRINAAMVRLRGTSDSIVTVGLACGFNDASYFTRAFRSLVGMTPSGYRRALQEAG